MKTNLEEPVEPGDMVAIAKPRNLSGYAIIRRMLRYNCMVSYLTEDGKAWEAQEHIAAENDLIFKLSKKDIEYLELPK